MSFVHLHVRSDHSPRDAACTVDDLVSAAADDGQPAIALTDTGVMSGVPELFGACAERGIQAIAGCTVTVLGRATDTKTRHEGLGEVPLLAAGATGYRSLCEISTAGFLHGYAQGVSYVDLSVLSEHPDGVIALAGGYRSQIGASAANGELGEARHGLQRLIAALGPRNVCVELALDGSKHEQFRNGVLADLARELGLEVVATADIHYLAARDRRTYAALHALSGGISLQTAEHELATSRLEWRTAEEMRSAFAHLPQAVEATLEIAERCRLELPRSTQLPRATPSVDEDAELRRRVFDGLGERVAGTVAPAAEERAEHELRVICAARLAPYFLIVADLLKH
nr:PHP domain-containing protein [Solirubrobacterales bacterium]